MRKQAFASVCLFGENNNSSISGIWVWRGQGLAFEVSRSNLTSVVPFPRSKAVLIINCYQPQHLEEN